MPQTDLDQLVEGARESASLGIPQITVRYVGLIRAHLSYSAMAQKLQPVLAEVEKTCYTLGIPTLLVTAESYAREGDSDSKCKLLKLAKHCASVIGQDISGDIARIEGL